MRPSEKMRPKYEVLRCHEAFLKKIVNFRQKLVKRAKVESCTSKNAIRKCNAKSGYNTKCDIPSFKHQNCCHTLKTARKINFLADAETPFALLNMQT